MVDRAIRMERFNVEWEKIATLFGISRPWRYVINNRTINPDWPLGNFFENMDDGSAILTVHMVLGVKGGGPVRLLTSAQLADTGNLSNLAEFEAQNFEGTDLKECTRFVDAIIKSAGHSAVAMILSQKPASKKMGGPFTPCPHHACQTTRSDSQTAEDAKKAGGQIFRP